MKVVYCKTVLQKVADAVQEAQMRLKKICHIELTKAEWNEVCDELMIPPTLSNETHIKTIMGVPIMVVDDKDKKKV